MAREQFHFDPVNHRYTPVRRSLQYKVFRTVWMLSAVLFLALLVRYITDQYFTHPKEIKLLAEKEAFIGQYLTCEERIQELEASILALQSRDDHLYRPFYQMDPIPQSIRQAGLGGSQRYNSMMGYGTSPMMIAMARRADLADVHLDIQIQSFNELLRKAERHAELIKHKPSIQPVSLQDFYWISSVYGYRVDPMSHRRTMHRGVDFAGRVGLDVHATGDGIVKYIKIARNGFGKEIVIDHGFGYTTRYAHLNTIMVHQGQKIKRGMVVATLGNTGKSTGPHLHYEVRHYNRAMNPKHFYAEDLTPMEYSEIVRQPENVDN